MRRTVIVLIVSSVILWGSTALGRRSPTTRLDGDPDEYQAKAIHNETEYVTWDIYRSGSGKGRTAVLVPGSLIPGQTQAGMIWLYFSEMLRSKDRSRSLWEVRFPGRERRSSGEGR